MYFTSEEIEEILRLLDATSHDELAIEIAPGQIVFRRGKEGGWTQETRTREAHAAILLEGTNGEKRRPATTAGGAVSTEAGVIEIRSPLAGTFYRAPKPGADPFVEIGSRVGPDTVVAIVETMKLMNSIHAGAEGDIAEICVGNGEFVESTTVLIRFKALRP
jgi:acetyl-CoA carboxylase biotin carboxyl carrier protein